MIYFNLDLLLSVTATLFPLYWCWLSRKCFLWPHLIWNTNYAHHYDRFCQRISKCDAYLCILYNVHKKCKGHMPYFYRNVWNRPWLRRYYRRIQYITFLFSYYYCKFVVEKQSSVKIDFKIDSKKYIKLKLKN